MKRVFLCLLALLACGGWCYAAPSVQEVRSKVARKVWQNECGGTVQGLVSWNKGENFPSLGIGHFIWYPRGVRGAFEESFPKFVQFAQSRGVRVPRVALGAAPWSDRKSFEASDVPGSVAAELRQWLASTTDVQADFIMQRSAEALKRLQGAARDGQAVTRRYYAVASTSQGMYALIDYVNFKGEGVNPSERYRGQGWGLLQVLEEMRDVPQGVAAAQEFSRAAQAVLTRRVQNSPPERAERRWLAGWINRCRTYAQPL